jgi:signal transduction histidine kinase
VKLRWHLTALVLASVAPVVMFTIVVIGRLQQEERVRHEQELVHVTRAITVTIDRELLGMTKTLQALAASPRLLAHVQRDAKELRVAHVAWSEVVLIDPSAMGAETPGVASDAVRRTVAQRQPVISDGFVDPGSNRFVVALFVSVERAGGSTSVLGVRFEPGTLMALVRDHEIPQRWAVGIVDRRGVTIARSRGTEFVGKPANPRFLQMAPASGVAPIQLPTLEGVPAYGGVSRSPLTGWLIGVSRSGHPIEASIQWSGWALIGIGLAFALLGLALAAFLASRITRPMTALSTSALTDGGLEILTRSGVTEIARLARSVLDAEREHDMVLRREARVETERLRSDLAHVGRVSIMGELSASLARELNQPLTAIAANAQAARRMLDGAIPSRAELGGTLEDIAADSRRAAEVIRRLRALFRNEISERAPVDVNELIAGVATLIHGEVERHRIALNLALEPALPSVTGDAIQIQQVLLNLLVNACEALAATDDARRELTITTAWRAPACVLVSVHDTGIGVKEGDTERVFAPFVSSKPNGLGMGLAISRSIVEAHDGRIWTTRNDDRGLTLNVELPALPRAA